MATLKHRINISLPKSLDVALAQAAKRDQVARATKATELLALAMEIEEDQFWDKLAYAREHKKAKFISHKDFWK